ncbi:putative beta- -glucosidase [Rosellinia necatrix]|uniref:Putative beta--glucosidase n=1 Tax=Rosellinia necatrix TaxID=77044 RepID=A0A1S7UPY8_ROSNE|nr:putative beta- -glucosidase [Rosellinia necatrix]
MTTPQILDIQIDPLAPPPPRIIGEAPRRRPVSTPRPKGVHTKHLTELDRFRVRTLYYDASLSKGRIRQITGYSPSQIRTAVRATSAAVGRRPGRPKTTAMKRGGKGSTRRASTPNGSEASAELLQQAREYFQQEDFAAPPRREEDEDDDEDGGSDHEEEENVRSIAAAATATVAATAATATGSNASSAEPSALPRQTSAPDPGPPAPADTSTTNAAVAVGTPASAAAAAVAGPLQEEEEGGGGGGGGGRGRRRAQGKGFNDLPAEVRAHIWQCALSTAATQPAPRPRSWAVAVLPRRPWLELGRSPPPDVRLDDNPPWDHYVATRHVPATVLAQVSREARRAVLSRHTPISVARDDATATATTATAGTPPPFVWVDRFTDVIHFRGERFRVELFDDAGRCACPELYR